MTFEKEFFPFLRYIIRFFTKELSCTQSLEEVARELASNKTQRNQESGTEVCLIGMYCKTY